MKCVYICKVKVFEKHMVRYWRKIAHHGELKELFGEPKYSYNQDNSRLRLR